MMSCSVSAQPFFAYIGTNNVASALKAALMRRLRRFSARMNQQVIRKILENFWCRENGQFSLPFNSIIFFKAVRVHGFLFLFGLLACFGGGVLLALFLVFQLFGLYCL